jgi:hypothetical protein
MTPILMSDGEIRSSKSKFWHPLLIIKLSFLYRAHPVFITALNQLHTVGMPVP